MASLGTAWVDIVPRISGLSDAMKKELSGFDGAGAGNSIGAALSKGLYESTSSGLSKIGTAFSAIGKAGLAAAGVAAGAVAAIGKQAFQAYGDWEQAVGGVDTLFKDASAKVQRYAQEAYATAGTSANTYMNQVTSFAAALVSSLGGNTDKAADMANTAMKDMADNANKMGTSLGYVQETYQSLARGNYEMLDSLKLGYGGTKSEMERLIADANKLAVANGQAGDLSIDKFSDVVEAIHLIQQNLGITGTTAEEAATTIQGSWGMLQAAWSNWTTEVGKDNADMKSRTAEVFTSAAAVASNALPRIQQIAEGAFQGVGQAAQQLLPMIPAPFLDALPGIKEFADGVANGSIGLEDIARNVGILVGAFGGMATLGPAIGPTLDVIGKVGPALDSAKGALSGFAKGAGQYAGLFDGLGRRWSSALAGVDMNFGGVFGILSNRLRDGIGDIGSTAVGLFDSKVFVPLQGVGSKLAAPFKAMASNVGAYFAPVTSAFGSAFQGFGGQLAGPLQNGLNAVGSTIMGFFNPANFLRFFGIGAIVAALIAGLGALDAATGGQIQHLILTVMNQLPALLVQVQAWVVTSLPQFLAAGVQLIQTLLQGLTTSLPQLVEIAANILTTLVNGLAAALPTLIPMGMTLIVTLVSALLMNLPQIITAGLNLLDGLVSGILNAIPQLVAALPQVITAFVTTIAANLPQILTSGVNILLKLVNGIINALPQLIAAAPKAITAFINAITPMLPQLISTGILLLVKLAMGLVQAIPQLVGQIPAIVRAIVNAFKSVDWGSVGLNIIKGIAAGIKGAVGSIVDAAKGAARSALDGAKRLLGIHSPSRVFRDQVGVMIGRGLAVGIDDSAPAVSKSASALGRSAVDAVDAVDGSSFTATLAANAKLDTASMYAAMPANTANTTPANTGMTREDMTAAVLAALNAMPDLNLRLNGEAAAAQLAPAMGRALADRSYRGL